MAVQNSRKPTENSLEINLNEVLVGKRRLRYIYHCEPNIVSTNSDKNNKCMPLFLGCDVLDECSISTGNLPRFHAKHARRGLATKVNFQSGVRIVGIHGTARGVWFYSIQGLFKIAFEYYTREEQQACLFKLRDVWERQILDPVLMSEINVMLKNSVMEDESHCASTSELVEEKINSNTVTCRVDEFVNHVNDAIDSYAAENSECLKYEIKLLKIYLSYMNEKRDLNSFIFRTISLLNSCLVILPQLSKELESLESSDSPTDSDGTTPINNLTSSNNLCKAPISNKSYEGSSQNHAGEENLEIFCKEAVITEIANWLGKEFLNHHDRISEKVTLFKQGNISNIGNLPTAKNLVHEVFPISMITFFCRWMRVPWNETTFADSEELQENRTNLFPVIQLMLELANESLVSGVAHVLFSQLVQSDSVQ